MHRILNQLEQAKATGQKKFVVLIDPDKMRMGGVNQLLEDAADAGVDYFFIGGSLIVNNMLDQCLLEIRERSHIPTILFPGNPLQLSWKADALLFLSLISGRNAELLIGSHVIAAPYLRASPLEILPTGYMLIDGGTATTAMYMSNTRPIPMDKPDVAACTAMAGEMLGLRLLYLDAGSGAAHAVSTDMIACVSAAVLIPLIAGGGIRTPQRAMEQARAGADIVVVGNALEKDPSLLREMAAAVHGCSEAAIGGGEINKQ